MNLQQKILYKLDTKISELETRKSETEVELQQCKTIRAALDDATWAMFDELVKHVGLTDTKRGKRPRGECPKCKQTVSLTNDRMNTYHHRCVGAIHQTVQMPFTDDELEAMEQT